MLKDLDTKVKVFIGIVGSILLLIIIFLILLFVYISNISPVSRNNQVKQFEVKQGDTYYSISSKLKENNLIKSEFFFKLYVKLNNPSTLKYGIHELNETMSVKDIIKEISQNGYKKGEMITFKEGLNMRQIADIIEANTNNTKQDVFDTLNDEEYIDSLIEKYWFITDEIKNTNIYYSLEGYLFPNTYEFFTDEVTVKQIFNTMLDEMANKLKPYKEDLEKSSYSVHEILTLASIVELESRTISDRNEVAGVFYNRLNSNWSLGSDVTTYYGAKINMSDRDLYVSEINEANSYNTRSATMAGKLPVGPICNPSISSIEAVLYPTKTDYYYFVADKNGKTYFSKTISEHTNIISQLKRDGLWYNY